MVDLGALPTPIPRFPESSTDLASRDGWVSALPAVAPLPTVKCPLPEPGQEIWHLCSQLVDHMVMFKEWSILWKYLPMSYAIFKSPGGVFPWIWAHVQVDWPSSCRRMTNTCSYFSRNVVPAECPVLIFHDVLGKAVSPQSRNSPQEPILAPSS